MKVLVPLKHVIDYSVKISVRPDKSGVNKSGVKMSTNPFCELGMEEALRMREKKIVENITAVTIGNEKSNDVLRTAFSLGADRAIHILTSKEIDKEIQPIHVSHILSQLVLKNSFDFVLMGKQAIDDDYNQTGQMLASILNWPQAAFASSINYDEKKQLFTVQREIDAGSQKVEISKNCVITCDLRLNKPRLPKLADMVKAKKKTAEKLNFEDFKLPELNELKIEKVEEPLKRKGGVILESVDELIDKLKNEAQVF